MSLIIIGLKEFLMNENLTLTNIKANFTGRLGIGYIYHKTYSKDDPKLRSY